MCSNVVVMDLDAKVTTRFAWPRCPLFQSRREMGAPYSRGYQRLLRLSFTRLQFIVLRRIFRSVRPHPWRTIEGQVRAYNDARADTGHRRPS
jgi:hypothetical protein